ncbi:hypothetical protein KHQ82_05360 [Mycoplasmatota bacterium]|nr:hypothetical protein KHQ82_05360 [Mycoplasmatota bacterium]
MAGKKNNIPGINLPWEYAIFIAIIVIVIGAIQWGWFQFGGVHEIDRVNPVVLLDVDSEVSTVEKEGTFDIEVKVDNGEDTEIIAFIINAVEYTEFVQSSTEDGLYTINVTADDLIGTKVYEVQKIKYQVDSEDKTLSIIEDDSITSAVTMTLTHNEPKFMGVAVNENVAVGTAAAVVISFDDVEGISEVVIDGITYDEETDFDVVDNAEEITVNIAGLSVGEHEYILESYTFDTGTQSIKVELTSSNTMTFDVVKAVPELLSIIPSVDTFTTSGVVEGTADYNLVITFDEVDDIFSITISDTKYVLSSNNDVTVNAVSDTITIALSQTDDTVGTYSFELEEFEFYNSLEMIIEALTEENTYSISVTA